MVTGNQCIGLAPTNAITSAVAKYVKGVVITSSPFPIPSALKESRSASVPELQDIAYFAPTCFAKLSSNNLTLFPRMYWPELKIFATFLLISLGMYASGTTVEPVASWRKNQARFKELDLLAKAIKKIT